MADDIDKTVIATLEKNKRESLMIYLDKFRGHDLVHARVHFRDDDTGDLKPTSKGVCVKPAKLDELIAALQDAKAECARRGLLEAR